MSLSVRLPLYFVVLLLLALVLNLARGFDLARRRSRDLQPRIVESVLQLHRAGESRPPLDLRVDARSGFLLVHLPKRPAGARLELQQIVGERRLTRWTESTPTDGEWLVAPLAGLPAGNYGFRWEAPAPATAAEDVDGVGSADAIDWLGRFTLH